MNVDTYREASSPSAGTSFVSLRAPDETPGACCFRCIWMSLLSQFWRVEAVATEHDSTVRMISSSAEEFPPPGCATIGLRRLEQAESQGRASNLLRCVQYDHSRHVCARLLQCLSTPCYSSIPAVCRRTRGDMGVESV